MKSTQVETFETIEVSSKDGFTDYDVKGLPFVHRCTVGHGIKQGDIFNVYLGESAKLGVKWKGDLQKSLQDFKGSQHYLHFVGRASKRQA